MNLLQSKLSTPQSVALIAKRLLGQHPESSITFSPYRLVRGSDDALLISTVDGRGIILVQRGDQIEANLKPCDYNWFNDKLEELEKLTEITCSSKNKLNQANVSQINSKRNYAKQRNLGHPKSVAPRSAMERAMRYQVSIEEL